jgi:pilus assembly protein Flp/PilA
MQGAGRAREWIMLKRFFVNERGATAIEYGLIASLIVVVIIGGISAVGTSTTLQLNNIAGYL